MERADNNSISESVLSALEQLDSFRILTGRDKAELALVLLGVKKAAEISFGEDIGKGRREIYHTEKPEFEEFLKSSGLHFDPKVKDYGGDDGEGTGYKITKDPSALDGMLDQAKERNQYIHGMELGYPETAAKAWQERVDGTENNLYSWGRTPPAELPLELRENEAFKCGFFTMSRDHWPEELVVAEKWAAALKEHCPKIYGQLLAQNEFEKKRDEEEGNRSI